NNNNYYYYFENALSCSSDSENTAISASKSKREARIVKYAACASISNRRNRAALKVLASTQIHPKTIATSDEKKAMKRTIWKIMKLKSLYNNF
ncbi:hypothetical protein PFISCL1PPCAC_17146, partial [Pristionchus fissidentatus]